jgi:hypothetical protein
MGERAVASIPLTTPQGTPSLTGPTTIFFIRPHASVESENDNLIEELIVIFLTMNRITGRRVIQTLITILGP